MVKMKKIRVSLKLSVKEWLWSPKNYQRVNEQKTKSVTFEDAAGREPVPLIANPTVVKAYDSNKQIRTSVSCQTAMEFIAQNTQFHPCGFPMNFYSASA